MRLYLDDDLDSNVLLRLLQRAGHEVISPRAVGNRGAADEEHLRYATAHSLTVLTANAQDFIDLHEEWTRKQQRHLGILIVYRENDPTRDMSPQQIAQAVTRRNCQGITYSKTNVGRWCHSILRGTDLSLT